MNIIYTDKSLIKVQCFTNTRDANCFNSNVELPGDSNDVQNQTNGTFIPGSSPIDLLNRPCSSRSETSTSSSEGNRKAVFPNGCFGMPHRHIHLATDETHLYASCTPRCQQSTSARRGEPLITETESRAHVDTTIQDGVQTDQVPMLMNGGSPRTSRLQCCPTTEM